MIRINRSTFSINTCDNASQILRLLCDIMMLLTQALPIVRRPEQDPIASMRLDVIDDSGAGAFALLEAHHTKWMLDEVLQPGLAPSVALATAAAEPRSAS
jgi:hypothetical protein